ncbi:MAG: hypothetical protein J6T64_00580, partial [Bacteroidaceae bacterium]|nr:hypothetical protein [Bacteroidaceae bacterium]
MKRFVSMALAWLLAMATWAQTDSAAVTQDSLIVARDSLALPQDSVAPDTVGAYVPRVSLLTCSPAAEVWQQYGHTAIRYEDTEHDVDVVFNYGL